MPRITVSIFDDRRQLETHKFEMAHHVDKRISDISFRINALQNGGPSPQWIFLQPSYNVGQRQK